MKANNNTIATIQSLTSMKSIFMKKWDGRKKAFKTLKSAGISKSDYHEMIEKRYNRYLQKMGAYDTINNRLSAYLKTIKYFSNIPYKFEGDEMDDFSKYQRPSSNGYVAICPGEAINNVFIDEPFAVKHLTRLYNENLMKGYRFEYSLLDRLRCDCDYYLGYGDRHVKYLWAGSEKAQIEKMRELYNTLPLKPEWLTLEDINNYAKKMGVE